MTSRRIFVQGLTVGGGALNPKYCTALAHVSSGIQPGMIGDFENADADTVRASA